MSEAHDTLVTLDVSGMTCAACSARVEAVLSRLSGVRSARVSLPLERADVAVDPGMDAARLIGAIADAGYHAAVRGADGAGRRAAREARMLERAGQRRRTVQLAVLAGVLAAPFLFDMIAMMITGDHQPLLPPWLQAGLALVVQVVCGARYYRGAWAALKNGFANMDVLVAIGTSAALGLSLFNLLDGRLHHGGGIYFEASVTVLAFLLIGKVLEGEAKSGASAALEALAESAPPHALKLVGGRETQVRSETLQRGDHVAVRPGSQVPADGRILEGQAAFDESLITGESLPVARGAGAFVVAGSVASGGRVVVEVTATGDDTRLQKIARLIEDAEIAKSPIQQLADRISAVFVPVVLLIAAGAGLYWWLTSGNGEHAVLVAVSVLVVACPCALGLATPIALVAGASACARAGLIITDHSALEAAGRVTRVAFDKTGTLTRGQPGVCAIAAAEPLRALSHAAALAAGSDHPLDRTLVAHAAQDGLPLPAVTGFSAQPGRGVAGTIDGAVWRMGNATFMRDAGLSDAAFASLSADEALKPAGSLAFLACGADAVAVIGFADEARSEVAQALAGLRRLGVAVTVLSGDRAEAVAAFAAPLGLEDARAALTPDAKIRAVNDLRAGGDVLAVVGDGINDAPALRAADIGIAMGTGTDAAKAAATVTLARPDPRLVASMLMAGRATRAVIAQNLAFAFLFNAIGIPLAAAGRLSPALAGAAMALSSVSVVLNAWRLARKSFAPD